MDWWKGIKYIDICLIKKMELLVNIYIVYKGIYVNCKLCKIFYNKVLGIIK